MGCVLVREVRRPGVTRVVDTARERRPATAAAPSGGPSRSSVRRRAFTLRRALTIALFLAPAFVLVAVFTYYPMVSGSLGAFRTWTIYNNTEQPWIGLENFRAVLSDPLFYNTVGNRFVWVVGSLVPQFVTGFSLALLMRRSLRFPGGNTAPG